MSQLQFQTISISNFKTFAGNHEFQLNRQPGLYYITGKNVLNPELGANGVGKSTIFDALLWVLWGRTGRDNRPADAVKPWVGKGQTFVSLRFVSSGVNYILDRKRNPNSLVIYEGAKDGREVQQEEVPKLLGMTEEMFRRTLVLGQFGTLFLDLKPEAQAQMFTEALSLDVWLRAVVLAGEQAKAAQQDADKAAADTQTHAALLASLTDQMADQQAKADTWVADQAERIRKGERGITSLEKDLEDASNSAPGKPGLPDDSVLVSLREQAAIARNEHGDAKQAALYAGNALRDLRDKLAGLLKDKVCPTCEQPIKKQNVAALVEANKAETVKAEKQVSKARDLEAKVAKQYKDLADKVAAELIVTEDARNNYEARLDAYEKAIRKISSIQGELKRWRDNLASVKAETNQAADAVAKLKQRRQVMRASGTALQEKQDTALAQVQRAKFWQDGFREIRLGIIDQTLVELEMATIRHAAMLGLNDWGIKFDTERETKAGTVSHGFSVLLYPPGQDQPVKWESYSGGESQRWQLAVSFALSEVLLARAGLTPNIEVLDEPTKGLSGAGVTDLLEHLRDRALELGRAIFFVDHHSLDKGAFDATLLVTKGKKGSTFAWQ